eukprot:CAMPEP_0119261052 /NCGR_PEP_ID=MMETSP1329-20130426/1231_1 /TAXON_ID=114041 /ORGANISM="Genus nov. species nov., Strain RCC1024" /LENGTH=359 /DNA_ID=CAMNT_0007260549 /DNA_START=174 /DNA_END=1249 /DNA_ORIENTATION=-
MASALAAALKDPARPVFLHGMTPPLESTSNEDAQKIAEKFVSRCRVLASDGFIVYDIQDEPSRSGADRPYPFRKLMDSGTYAARVRKASGKECLVYKCVDDEHFHNWVRRAAAVHDNACLNIVGRPAADAPPRGPPMKEAMAFVNETRGVSFGCVCIPERHTDEYAAARGKAAPGEHENMLRKQRAGAEWFVSQAVYDPAPTIRLLKDYGDACRAAGLAPCKVVLTFAPCGRPKTMTFLKWLGIKVPEEAEKRILEAESPVDESVALLCETLERILDETAGCGVPLGVSVESVSIFRKEIDAVHELMRRTQAITLDKLGFKWKVTWDDVSAEKPSASPTVPSNLLATAAIAAAVASVVA